ncbi:MAG: GNAT family N-acetyltransferase [Firmicutes bacterium]|nr:GNAT family N-acetyltransferase [Bacillota bacterium]
MKKIDIQIEELNDNNIKYRMKYSKLEDDDSKSYYAKMLKDLKKIYNGNLINMDYEDITEFLLEFNKHSDKKFLFIKLDNKVIGEVYLYECDNNTYFNILIDTEYRNNGYGKKAMKALYDYVFSKNYKKLVFETMSDYDEIASFFIKCGFIVECEYESGYRILIFTDDMYNRITISKPDIKDRYEYFEYLKEYKKSKLPKKFDKLVNNKNYSYYFYKKDEYVIGYAKVAKKNNRLFNPIYIEIHPQYRNEGYGTRFLNAIIKEKLSDEEIWDSYEPLKIKVHYKNIPAIKMLSKTTNKVIPEYVFMNKIVFEYGINNY